MQESHKNCLHENFAKDRDTLIEQTIFKFLLYMKFFK